MKFGIIVFPGSNCDRDMVHVLGEVMGAEVETIFHKETSLDGFTSHDCVILPGGFRLPATICGQVRSHTFRP